MQYNEGNRVTQIIAVAVSDTYFHLQIRAFACSRVEIGVLDMVCDKMQLRTVSVEDAGRLLPWLKYRNAHGGNIYVRPAWPHAMTLVDDLSSDAVLAMQAQGFEPSLLIETSPDNFQAWLDNGRLMDKPVATRVARLIAARFGADENSADWRHLGRLAGFTNRKEKYRDAGGRFPFVRLHPVLAPTGGYAEAASVVAEAERELAAERQQQEARRQAMAATGARVSGDALPIAHFWRDARYGGDYTRADLAFAIHALGRGLGAHAVRAAIAGRDLSHKGSRLRQDDYIERTVKKALAYLEG